MTQEKARGKTCYQNERTQERVREDKRKKRGDGETKWDIAGRLEVEEEEEEDMWTLRIGEGKERR